MIRNHFKRLLAELEFAQSRVITLREIAEATDVHRNTLTRFANDRNYNAGLDVVDRLCRYFKCEVSDLLEFVDDGLPAAASKSAKS